LERELVGEIFFGGTDQGFRDSCCVNNSLFCRFGSPSLCGWCFHD